MAAPPIRKSKLSQSQRDTIRKQRVNSSRFDPAFIGEGGPIEIYQQCGFVNSSYRKGYDQINWNHQTGVKYDKTMPEMRQDLQGQP